MSLIYIFDAFMMIFYSEIVGVMLRRGFLILCSIPVYCFAAFCAEADRNAPKSSLLLGKVNNLNCRPIER